MPINLINEIHIFWQLIFTHAYGRPLINVYSLTSLYTVNTAVVLGHHPTKRQQQKESKFFGSKGQMMVFFPCMFVVIMIGWSSDTPPLAEAWSPSPVQTQQRQQQLGPSFSFGLTTARTRKNHGQRQRQRQPFQLLQSSRISVSQDQAQQATAAESIASSSKSRDYKPSSQRVQLQLLFQSLEKTLRQEQQQQQQQQDNKIHPDATLLLKAMDRLIRAQTTPQIVQAGQLLQNQLEAANYAYSPDVLERVAKATAMMGLLPLSLHLTHHMMLEQNQVPSEMCQVAICRALRRVGRLQQMEAFLVEVGRTASQSNGATAAGVSPFAFNIFLAALCDPIVDKTTDRTCWAPVNPNKLLAQAYAWLDPKYTQQQLGERGSINIPDSISYATVLNAALEAGNTTLVDTIWKQAQEQQQLELTLSLCNARLKSLQDRKEYDEQALDLWHQMTSPKSNLKPDRYTINLILLPLLRAGRVGDLEAALDDFIYTHPQQVVSDAFEAFLNTIVVQGGDVAAARAIFDMYMGPSLDSSQSVGAPISNDSKNKSKSNTTQAIRLVRPATRRFTLLVKPSTRQFTILLEGYKQQIKGNVIKQLQQNSTSLVGDIGKTNETKMGFESFVVSSTPVLYDQAWKLFRLQLKSPNTQPDQYTTTIMMGLCRSSHELTSLLAKASQEFGLHMSSATLRAAMTRYGELGDSSSACVLFANFVKHPATIRYWNVLLGALVKSVESTSTDHSLLLDTESSTVHKVLSVLNGRLDGNTLQGKGSPFLSELNGLSPWEAADLLVNSYVETPNSQAYCLLAMIAQNKPADAELALEIFRNATSAGVPADGRFANAIIRCFGADIDAAVNAWKSEIRRACLVHENRVRDKPMSPRRVKGKNLLAAYHALLYVSGKALQPDVALRLVYAMKKEGLEPDETALNCYKSGKRNHVVVEDEDESSLMTTRNRVRRQLRTLLKMNDAYESLLYVECVKYNQNDQRRAGEKRIRIIL